MRTELKLAILVTLVLWLGGCVTNLQIGGKQNTIHRQHKEKDRKIRLWGRPMRANSMQETWERGNRKD